MSGGRAERQVVDGRSPTPGAGNHRLRPMTQARKSDSTGRLPEDTNELVESKKVVIMRPTKLLIIVTAALLCVAASDLPGGEVVQL